MMKDCELFKAFSNQTRLKIFQMLAKERLCVSKIVEKLKVAQPTVTQHLRILKQAGLIKSEKVGPWMHYSIDSAGIKKCKANFDKFNAILEKALSVKKGSCSRKNCCK